MGPPVDQRFEVGLRHDQRLSAPQRSGAALASVVKVRQCGAGRSGPDRAAGRGRFAEHDWLVGDELAIRRAVEFVIAGAEESEIVLLQPAQKKRDSFGDFIDRRCDRGAFEQGRRLGMCAFSAGKSATASRTSRNVRSTPRATLSCARARAVRCGLGCKTRAPARLGRARPWRRATPRRSGETAPQPRRLLGKLGHDRAHKKRHVRADDFEHIGLVAWQQAYALLLRWLLRRPGPELARRGDEVIAERRAFFFAGIVTDLIEERMRLVTQNAIRAEARHGCGFGEQIVLRRSGARGARRSSMGVLPERVSRAPRLTSLCQAVNFMRDGSETSP